MYSYSNEETFPIEDVSYEINILGVKASIIPHLFGLMLGCLFLGSSIHCLAIGPGAVRPKALLRGGWQRLVSSTSLARPLCTRWVAGWPWLQSWSLDLA